MKVMKGLGVWGPETVSLDFTVMGLYRRRVIILTRIPAESI